MSKMVLAFAHDPSDWISRVMAWFSFAKVTHVALVSQDREWVIEASAVGYPKGVRLVPMPLFLAKHPWADLRTIEHKDPLAAWDFARTQVGKGYDWRWIVGRLLRLPKLQHRDKWACSELICWAAREAGDPIFVGDTDWHITPADLRMISGELRDV